MQEPQGPNPGAKQALKEFTAAFKTLGKKLDDYTAAIDNHAEAMKAAIEQTGEAMQAVDDLNKTLRAFMGAMAQASASPQPVDVLFRMIRDVMAGTKVPR